MSALALLKPKVTNDSVAGPARNWLSPLNLHWAGVGLLVLVNLYLLGHMAYLWHESSKYNADAMAAQRIELKTAEIAAVPLRGLDAKLPFATEEADRFSRERLPATDSDMLREFGALTRKAGVRLTRGQYAPATVLAGTPGELTEVRMDATLTGDYRPLVLFLNALERDKMFFVVNRVTLTGQQTGTVSLRMGLTTYLRNAGTQDLVSDETSGDADASTHARAGGPAQ
jgi:type IV pilus assembly protein PilO